MMITVISSSQMSKVREKQGRRSSVSIDEVILMRNDIL
jgi:hypothetical protein